jgi:large-conductance mechanosensitive channel
MWDFASKHIAGWLLAVLTVIGGFTVNSVYQNILTPLQAQAAAGQLDDSNTSWVLHQQMSYGDVIPNVIIGMTIVFTFLFLLPTIKHAIRLAKTD